MDSADVVVVGAGIIGAACAYELASSGRDVLVIERGTSWAGECTAASAGLICPSHAEPLASLESVRVALRHVGRSGSPLRIAPHRHLWSWLARYLASAGPNTTRRSEKLLLELALRNLTRLYDLADGGVVDGIFKEGILYLHRSERGFARAVRHATTLDDAGQFEIVTGRDVKQFVRSSARQCAGGLYYPGEAHCQPVALTESLGRAAQALGARSWFGEEAIGIRAKGTRAAEVALPTRIVRASSVVVCAGLASRKLVGRLGTRLPLVAGRGYAIDVLARPPANVPVYLQEERVVMTPLPDGTRLSGTFELVPADWPRDERRITAIRKSGELIGLTRSAPVASVRIGIRPCLPDGLPAVGALREAPSVIVATGHAMLGLTLALSTADTVRSTLDLDQPHADLALSPTRFERWRPIE